jgi:hypothetical protein
MVQGPMILILAIVVLAALWAIVIPASTLFGPKE